MPASKSTIYILVLLTLLVGTIPSEQVYARGKAKAKAAAKPKKPPAAYYLGLEEFQKGRFGPAAEAFEEADRQGYCNDQTHYYLGLAYHNLNQTQRAVENYSWVYSYSKNPTLKYNAYVGYNQVARYANNRTYAGNGGVFSGFSYRTAMAGSGRSTGG